MANLALGFVLIAGLLATPARAVYSLTLRSFCSSERTRLPPLAYLSSPIRAVPNPPHGVGMDGPDRQVSLATSIQLKRWGTWLAAGLREKVQFFLA